MIFGKIENDVFISSPTKIQILINNKNYIVYNPSDDILLETGWLPVEEIELSLEPPEGFQYIPVYIQTDTKIIQNWELVESSNDIAPEEALSIITGGYV